MSEARDISLPKGPRFERSADGVLFTYVIDERNVVGPRAVTDADKVDHADAWAAFCAAEEPAPEVSAPKPKTRRAKAH